MAVVFTTDKLLQRLSGYEVTMYQWGCEQCFLFCEQKRKGNLSILTYRSAGG